LERSPKILFSWKTIGILHEVSTAPNYGRWFWPR
jgi:hypothetical protein